MRNDEIVTSARNVALAFRKLSILYKWTPQEKREAMREGSRLIAIVYNRADEIAETLEISDYTSQWEAFSRLFEDAYKRYFDEPANKAPHYLIGNLYNVLTGNEGTARNRRGNPSRAPLDRWKQSPTTPNRKVRQ